MSRLLIDSSRLRPLGTVLLTAWLLGMSASAQGAGSGMPWETPLQSVLDSITGPVANALGVIAITAFGLLVAFSEGGGMLARALQILLGLSIAYGAVSFFLTFFGFAGGLAF
jgi:type IV secretory pathway VirB2 component (pilin)